MKAGDCADIRSIVEHLYSRGGSLADARYIYFSCPSPPLLPSAPFPLTLFRLYSSSSSCLIALPEMGVIHPLIVPLLVCVYAGDVGRVYGSYTKYDMLTRNWRGSRGKHIYLSSRHIPP